MNKQQSHYTPPGGNGANEPDKQRVPESERVTIGAVCIDPPIINRISYLRADWFTDTMPRFIWTSILRLHKKGTLLDEASISQAVERDTKKHVLAVEVLTALKAYKEETGTSEFAIGHARAICQCAQSNAYMFAGMDFAYKRNVNEHFATLDDIKSWLPAEDDGPINDGTGPILASTITPKQYDWLWRNYIILGGITDVFGAGGVGKSTIFEADIPARISRGHSMPDGQPCEALGNVLIVEVEDDTERTVIPRLIAHGANMDRVYILRLVRDRTTQKKRMLSLETDMEQIEQWIRDYNIVYTVISPIMAFLGNKKAISEQDVRSIYGPLADIAERTRCALVPIRHTTKSSNGNAAYEGGGSVAFINAARMGMRIDMHPDEPEVYLLSQTKKNLIRGEVTRTFTIEPSLYDPQIGHIHWLGTSELKAQDISERNKEQKSNRPEPGADIVTLLQKCYPEPMHYGEISQQTDRNDGATRTALSRLVDKGRVEKLPGNHGLYRLIDKSCNNGNNVTTETTVTTETNKDKTEGIVTDVTDVTVLQPMRDVTTSFQAASTAPTFDAPHSEPTDYQPDASTVIQAIMGGHGGLVCNAHLVVTGSVVPGDVQPSHNGHIPHATMPSLPTHHKRMSAYDQQVKDKTDAGMGYMDAVEAVNAENRQQLNGA